PTNYRALTLPHRLEGLMEFRDDGLDARDDALCPRLPLVAVTNMTERDRLSAEEDPGGHSAVGIPLLGQGDPVALSRVETFNDVGREMTGLLRRLLIPDGDRVRIVGFVGLWDQPQRAPWSEARIVVGFGEVSNACDVCLEDVLVEQGRTRGGR